MIQHLNQLDTEMQQNLFLSEKSILVPLTSEKVPPQQDARSDFGIPTPVAFHVIIERQKRAILTDAFSFTEKPISNSTNSLPFEKNFNNIFSIPLIREHHDSHLCCVHYKSLEKLLLMYLSL